MKGLTGVRITRIWLHFTRRRDRGQIWVLPFLKLAKLLLKLYRLAVRRGRSFSGAQPEGRLPCPVPFREMVINCDGTVACGSTAAAPILDAYGDNSASSLLSAIWEGAAFRAMRARMMKGDSSGCDGCQLYRCPGFDPLTELDQSSDMPSQRPLRQLLIEPTALCNLDCPTICGQSYPKARQPISRRTVKFMPMALFRRIVEGIDRPIEQICFYNYGEPLLHPEFSAMCRLMRERCPSAYMVTSTNGSMLSNPGVRTGLLESGLDEIIVSLDGAKSSTYEVYRRGGRFQDILSGMRLLREERDRADLERPHITWRYILFPWNDSSEELALAERLAKEAGVDRFCYHLSDLPEMASRTYRPGTPALERIRGQLF